MVEYKETLNLPQTTLEMRANATRKEPETQKFWEGIWLSVTSLILLCCTTGLRI